MIVALGQIQPSPYIQAAEAIAAKYMELNAATPYPAILYDLSPGLIDQFWGTREVRAARRTFYERSIQLRFRRRTRSVLYPSRMRSEDYTDGHYAGVVITYLERKIPDLDVGVLLSIGDIALQLMTWTRARYPDMPRGLVCDVILAMNGYFGIPEEERPREGIPPEPEEKEPSTVGGIALKIGIPVITALLVFAFTRGRRR